MSRRTNLRLLLLPLEIQTDILVASGDLAVAVKIECIRLGIVSAASCDASSSSPPTISSSPAGLAPPSRSHDATTTTTTIFQPFSDKDFPACTRIVDKTLKQLTDACDHPVTVDRWSRVVVDWLRHFRPNWEPPTVLVRAAAGAGRLDLISYLDRCRPRTCLKDDGLFRTQVVDIAAASGHLHVLQYCFNTRWIRCTLSAAVDACANGHLDVVKFLKTKAQARFPRKAFHEAVRGGHIDVVKYLREQFHFPCRGFTIETAVLTNNLPMVRYLHRHKTGDCCPRTFAKAAAMGSLSIVEYLHWNCKTPTTTLAMDSASANGHVDVVAFLHWNRTEGCTKDAMHRAAINGHMEVVQFLHRHRREGCYGDHTLCEVIRARAPGYIAMLTFLLQHRWEVQRGASLPAFECAVEAGDREAVLVLMRYRQGAIGRGAIEKAVAAGTLGIEEALTIKAVGGKRTDGWNAKPVAKGKKATRTRSVTAVGA
ncbi:hypothetical protein HDU96_002416 [Phlyctochytrium bullatum]|nr:hypothetical protein HDU96_002416 [Phlyctochytrium bullatum]